MPKIELEPCPLLAHLQKVDHQVGPLSHVAMPNHQILALACVLGQASALDAALEPALFQSSLVIFAVLLT
jgi:hypothetical protein